MMAAPMNDNKIAKQATLCANIAQLRQQYKSEVFVSPVNVEAIVTALLQFQECVRYLNTRRSSGMLFNLESEADVQDAVYLMLRPWVHDLVWENPTDRVAGRYSIKDFLSPLAETVIEVKYVRDASHGKQISREMHDDIEVYRHHPKCKNIVFFVYDPDSLIPDQGALKQQIEEARTYGNRALRCFLIIKP